MRNLMTTVESQKTPTNTKAKDSRRNKHIIIVRLYDTFADNGLSGNLILSLNV